jgi:hypothetical protein
VALWSCSELPTRSRKRRLFLFRSPRSGARCLLYYYTLSVMGAQTAAVFVLSLLAFAARTASALDDAQPQQVHLALTDKPQQIAVSWSTAISAQSCVEFTPVQQLHEALLRGGRRSLQAFPVFTERVCGASHNFTDGSPALHTQVKLQLIT